MRYDLKFKSLKTKVLFWFISSISVLLFIFSYLFYYFLEESINLRIETNMYQSSLKVYDKFIKQIDNPKKIDLQNFQFVILKDGKQIYKSKDFHKNIDTYINKDKIFFINEISEYEIEAFYILKFTKPYRGTIVLYKKGISNKAEDVEDILLFLNPLLLLVLLFIGNKLINKILTPIKEITKSAKSITIENFSHTITLPQTQDEIKELVQTFNEMINRLQSQVQMIDRFNSDISHELKTPLTVIQAELELALKKQRSQDEYKNSIKTVLEQTKELYKLIEALLFLTKYTKENIKDTFEPCMLDSILLNISQKYEKTLKEKNITLSFDTLESIYIKTNLVLIQSIFSNIIDNAIKYTPFGKKISISLYKQNSKIYFIVKDEGIGINEKDIPYITDRFYRVDKSRNKSIKGFGLGLSIVNNSIELLQGTLEIKSKINQGTKVVIVL